MPGSSQIRLTGEYSHPLNPAGGTLCLWELPLPGPLGAPKISVALGAAAVHHQPGREAQHHPGKGAAALGRTARVVVTEEMIREAMKDAPLQSQQKGGISLPRVQRFVDMLQGGQEPPSIKVDGNMIVDGNHRYIAARVLRIEPPVQIWAGGRPHDAIAWDQIPVDPKFW
jgi:hypothetical protein